MNNIPVTTIEQFTQKLNTLTQELATFPQNPKLLAVSKQQSVEQIAAAFLAGHKLFGENYAQEAVAKILQLSTFDIEWHFIGPIQSNKCKTIAEHFHWVQSLDRLKIAEKLNSYCPQEKVLNVCVQVNIDQEIHKSGILENDVADFCQSLTAFPRLKLRGLMTIPKATQSHSEQRQSFAKLAQCFKQLKMQHPHIDTLSMGMSHDYRIALEEGATMIRLGSKLFGVRDK
jgi:pyridoxal phosphate enzyme (YggS family)